MKNYTTKIDKQLVLHTFPEILDEKIFEYYGIAAPERKKLNRCFVVE